MFSLEIETWHIWDPDFGDGCVILAVEIALHCLLSSRSFADFRAYDIFQFHFVMELEFQFFTFLATPPHLEATLSKTSSIGCQSATELATLGMISTDHYVLY